jgi:hypothetical protein
MGFSLQCGTVTCYSDECDAGEYDAVDPVLGGGVRRPHPT